MNPLAAQTLPADNHKPEAPPLGLNDRLALISLIEDGMRHGLADAPIVADLFSNLWTLVAKTVSGAKVDRLRSADRQNGFKMIEIKAESGDILGHLTMLYLNKPIPCYYLVYVEVAAPFRKQGLGNLILDHCRDFLDQKSAIGLLDNIIPKDDPTNDIYVKHGWEPLENIVGDEAAEGFEGYMVYLPPRWAGKPLRQPMTRLVNHLKRRRAVIDMRDNENMVRQTIAEFRELYRALLVYFADQLETGARPPLMRFMFTRFVTKLIAFRRRIGELVGYTGGDSLEQLVLDPRVLALPIQSYAPKELAGPSEKAMGDAAQWDRLPEDIRRDSTSAIERLPNYRRPSLTVWLAERGKTAADVLTIGDLMDLGFDPTRLKEIEIDGETHIFERMQARQIPDLLRTRELLEKSAAALDGLRAGRAEIKTNLPLLALHNRGNAYVLRRKVPGIHWEEAVGQLKGNPALRPLNAAMGFDRLVQSTVRQTYETASEKLGEDFQELRDRLSCFVSWDLEYNLPRLVVDMSGSFLETVWLA